MVNSKMKKLLELLFLGNLKGIANESLLEQLSCISGLKDCIDLVRESDSSVSKETIHYAEELAKRTCASLESDPSIHAITIFDDNYPRKLDSLGCKKPLVLFVKGNVEALQNDNLAIVGSREPSSWSVLVERQLVKKILSLSGRTIVSGLALGCDRIAHEVTVQENGTTIAVLPSGVNVITPSSHNWLAESILETGGCLVSEYLPNARAFRFNYIERDSLLAALSDGVAIVECAIRSGTMHTVRAARSIGRKLACYCPNSKANAKGNYTGNFFAMEQYGAYELLDTAELKQYLESL